MNRPEEHRDDELLLRLADGELEAKEADLAQAHLKACWRCRMRFEDLQSSIAEYMRYRESVMKPLLPPPPQPWGSLRGRLREVDAELAPPRRWRIPHASPGWLATAAAAVLIVLVADRFWREPVVSAAEILRKASAAEAGPSPRRRIQIKTRARTLVRARSLHNKSLDGTADLQALFAAANFSWEEPLSARSFEAWHGQLSDKVDTVSILDRQSGGGRLYEIRTATTASSLTDAELTVRATDWQPVHEILQFRAGERVEISELDDAPADLPPPVSVAASRPVPAPIPDHTASAGDELHVIAALHGIGADLGEPIEVTRSKGGGIQVAAAGLEAARKDQLRDLLAKLPGVNVRFDEAQTVPAGKDDQRREARSSTTPVSMLQLQLQSYLGSAAALQKFTDGILDVSDGAMARAHALRNLAERFPLSEEQTLSAADRSVLVTLRREHANALKDLTRRMVQLVQPVLAIPESGAAPRAGSWQDGTRDVLESTRQVDRLLNQMLAGGDSNHAHAPQELASALASLRAQLAADETR